MDIGFQAQLTKTFSIAVEGGFYRTFKEDDFTTVFDIFPGVVPSGKVSLSWVF